MFQKLKSLLTPRKTNLITPHPQQPLTYLNKLIPILNFLLTAFFITVIYFIVKTEYLRIDVFGGDFFKPIYAGYVFNQGLSNNLFYSALGFIYDILNGISFTIMDKFSIGFNKIYVIPSLIFSIFIAIIWLASRTLTKYKIPFIALLLGIILCNGMINGALAISIETINYGNSYNSPLWIIIFLQMTFLILILKQRQNLKTVSKKDLFGISFVMALCAYITFNYKMNVFVGFYILSSSIILFLSIKNERSRHDPSFL
jgi:hypothetical protein